MTESDNIRITTMVEDVFAITLDAEKFADNSQKPEYIQMVYLEELAESLKPQKYIDIETLEQALFERLMLENITSFVLPKSCKPPYIDFVVQNKVILYLSSAYTRLKKYYSSKDKFVINIVANMKALIVRNACTAMEQPDIFQEQVIWEQFFEIFKEIVDNSENISEFILDIMGTLNKQENGMDILKATFVPILVHVHRMIAGANLINLEYWTYSFVLLFASNICLAGILLDYATPKSNDGRAYAETIFGSFLSLSILPKSPFAPYEYFENPLEMQIRNPMEGTLWTALEHLGDQMHGIFLKLLRIGGEIRPKTLDWIAGCLHSNNSRGQIWSTQIMDIDPSSGTCVSDAFMLNLGAVMLRMCRPFCKDYRDGKVLRVDPTYGAVEEQHRLAKGVHMKGLCNDTCLLPVLDGGVRPTSDQYSFPTECYFMTQKCLDIGYRVCVERLTKQNQDIARIQRAYNDAREQGSPATNHLLQRMTLDMTKYLSLRSTLFEPSMLQLLQELHTSTAAWITQVSINNELNEMQKTSSEQLTQHDAQIKLFNHAPMRYRELKFPLTEPIPDTLRCVPEFVIENTICFHPFVRHFNNVDFVIDERSGSLEPILTMVLVFMGSDSRMVNPHLRAKLAECLESMLPSLKEDHVLHPMMQANNPLNTYARQRLFTEHPHRLQIISSLLNVFVGIEMTGQSVQFEQKFNYRRPMYVVMDYLWQMEEHRKCFHNLALEAERNMEATDPPLFLRFANLLLNDAVFLLDESLSNMAQLRTMQAARANGDWNNLSANEREQNIGNVQRIGMMARFDNILGRETIHTIQYLTSEVKGVFCHNSMVDRVASMLNYFLLHLVGPNKKNFKVKDSQDYDFEPANIVLNISRIYVNLSESDAFCLAISQDGRSYSQQLFVQAEDVLARIGGGPLIGDLRVVADRVHALAEKQQREEEALAEAPEEFLDPIMSTLMTDPVILPSSRTTVDRATIARHLLSDQTDPFNRSPLSMDLVKSNTELKLRIEEWIKERKKKANSEDSTEPMNVD